MARPLQKGLGYFPLDTNFDDTIELLEAKFGLEGFAIFIKLLQKIYSNNYYLDWNEEIKLLFVKRHNLNINLVNEILNYCLEKNIFNNNLFSKFSILTSAGIQSRYFKAIERRKNIEIINAYILIDLKDINATFKEINVDINSSNVDINSQSKVKNSIVYNIKEEEIKEKDIDINMPFTPPDDIKSIQIIFSDWNNIICKQYPEFQKITESEFEMDIKLQQLLYKLKDKWETGEILTLYGTNEWLRLNAKFLKWWNINNYEKALQGKFDSYKQNTVAKTEYEIEVEKEKEIRRLKEHCKTLPPSEVWELVKFKDGYFIYRNKLTKQKIDTIDDCVNIAIQLFREKPTEENKEFLRKIQRWLINCESEELLPDIQTILNPEYIYGARK